MAEGSGVTRLPVQHRHHPRCVKCGRDAPTFDGVHVNLSTNDLAGWDLVAMTYHVVCPCGAEWNLKKTVAVKR
jgi:hypothetical protein